MMPSPPGEESKTAPPPLEIDTERTIQRRNSSLDEDTTDVLAHLEASPSPKGKSRAFPFPSPRRNRLSSDDIAPPDDDVEAIIEGAEEGRLPRLLPEGDRAALIERLRTDLFEVQRDSELSASQKRPASPLPPTPVSVTDSTDTQKLGTFKGVFLPCLQNILGIILYLRLTWITGQAGTFGTSGIVLICACSTFLTALSLSAIATNGRVEAGGPYFVISRNLGPEVGVAVGILFYLGTTIAASMYVLGAVEMLFEGFSVISNSISIKGSWDWAISALVLMLALALIVKGGVRHVNRAAPIFLSVVILSIILLLLGIFLFAGGAYSGALSIKDDRDFGDNVQPDFEKTDARSRRPAVPSRHRRASSPGMMEVGGLVFDFELFRAASGPSRRVRERGRGDGAFATTRRSDAVDAAARDLPRRPDAVVTARKATRHSVPHTGPAATETRLPVLDRALLSVGDGHHGRLQSLGCLGPTQS